jgi:TfoX/Sxy family transcriptional regulator of competence genes
MSVASDELGDRIRNLIGHKPGITEKKMFGGYGFMLYGNMVVGSMSTGELLMRVGPERHAAAVARPGASAMVQAGREMIGFVMVANDAIEDDGDLKDAIDFAWNFVKTMPPKDAASAKKASVKKTVAKKAPAKKAPAKTAKRT